MFATWASESDGIGTFTVVDAASVQISAKGTKLDQQAVSYAEQVYATDAFGNVTPVSDTFSSGDSSSTTVAVDRTLSIGTLIGATIPVTSCTYVGDEVLCLDTVVHVDGQWTGVGSTTKTQDGSSGGIAGVLLTVYRNVSTHRAATATATVDGVALGISSEASLDRSTIGWHEVHVGR